MSTDGQPTRLHLWSGLIILGIFLAGAAAGAGLHARMHPHFNPHGGPGKWGGGQHGLPPDLEALDLTADQQTKAKTILEEHHQKMEALLRESFPKMRDARETMEKKLRAILTDAQVKKFDELNARHPPRGPFGGPGMHGPMGDHGPGDMGGPGGPGPGVPPNEPPPGGPPSGGPPSP